MSFGSAAARGLTSLHGRKAMVTNEGAYTSQDKRTTHPCVDATITVGSESADVRDITIQLLDAYGNDVSEVTAFQIAVFANDGGTALASTGGSTGLEIGTDGLLEAIVAKKLFFATSEADGDWDGTWTDTATETVAIGVILPNGNVIISEEFANA